MFDGIDLYSDTVTKPCTAMREAMINAEVGDDQKGEDPTTRKLEQTIAALLERALHFFCLLLPWQMKLLSCCTVNAEKNY